MAHRMLHVRALYKYGLNLPAVFLCNILNMYVHSLHHRNADPEPFSGISMHPGAAAPPPLPFGRATPDAAAVEHMYYFSNAFVPALLLPVSPFVFLWLFVHLSFSPAAGHSGCVTPSLGFGLIGGPKSKIDNKSHLYC